MAELAKTHIEIIDESQYGAGVSSIIPFYIFATAENKVVDEDTGEIAPGTTKETANEVMILTSQQDVVQTYGVPYFETVDGTVQQGHELNEVGLYALYSGLGAASVAYAMRADIDLAQLKSTDSQPVGAVANGTKWLDENTSSYGLFRADGSKGYRGWEKIDNVLLPKDSYIVDGAPIDTYGKTGDIAFVCVDNEFKYFENIAQKWYQIGSAEWKSQFPSSVSSSIANAKVANASVITVMGKDTATIAADSTPSVVADRINELGLANVNAVVKDGILTISNDVEELIVKQKSGSALTDFGFELKDGVVVVKNSPALTFSSHTKVPSSEIAGSIWVKTTEPNYGASYVMKEYSKPRASWIERVLPMVGSFVEAETSLVEPLKEQMVIKYDAEKANAKIYRNVGGINEVSATKSGTLVSGDSLVITTVSDGKAVKAEVVVNAGTHENFAVQINKAKLPNIIADVNNGLLRIVSSTGNVIVLENGKKGDILTALGISNGEHIGNTWVEADYIVSELEPVADPAYGTMWFDDDFVVDIMVNDGESWRGYKSVYPCADIFVTSEEPVEKDNGNALQENDLWLDTNDSNYPTIYKYVAGEWVMVDNTDQTTPDGIIFADARENAGPEYTGSSHIAFSTSSDDLMVSDYVDPECVNPLTYPAGILLFNTLYSTNNVKEFTNKYASAVKTYGDTYVVGGENGIAFPTPGSATNPKTTRWSTKSGNALDGSGLFGRKAQRALVVKALAEAINSNQDIRSDDYDFFFVNCAGYPELDDEIANLNSDKKEMFYNVSDTPARLAPNANLIQAWGTNKNNAASHGEDGRVIRSAYQTRQYPSMGLTSNVDGSEIAVPSSIVKMKNLLVLPRGRIAAGTQYGQVTNVSSVGYITSENEYAPVTIQNGLGEILVAQSINPIMPRRNTGLLLWGESTENPYTSSLSDEHTILTILRLKRELETACLPFFFQLNTQAVRNDFDATLRRILNDYVAREELYDYTLVTDNSVNTVERIERKELWGELAVEAVKSVEQIYIPIRIVKTGSLSATN